jgi:hypothetical protein
LILRFRDFAIEKRTKSPNRKNSFLRLTGQHRPAGWT